MANEPNRRRTTRSATPKSQKNQQNALGRPKGTDDVFTKEKRAEVLAYLRLTGHIGDSCQIAGVSERGLLDARKRDDLFDAEVRQAMVYRKMASLRLIAESLDWRAHAWLLKCKFPQEFSERAILELSGQVKHEVTAQDYEDLSIDECQTMLDEIRSKRKVVDVEAVVKS